MNNRKTFTAAILTFAKMMGLVASIAVASALSRLLDKEIYGAFCQILVVYTMSSIIVRSGLPQSVYYFLPRLKPTEQRGFVVQAISIMFIFGLTVGAFIYFGADFIGEVWNSEHLPNLLKNFSLYPSFVLPIMVMESVFMSFNRVKTVFLYNIFSKILMFFVIVIPVLLGYSIVCAIRCWVVYAIIQFILLGYFVNKVIVSREIKFCYLNFLEQIKYYAPLSIAAILGAFAAYADKIVVNTLGNPKLFAEYFNGAFELPLISVVGGAVTLTMLPVMTEYVKEERFDKFLSLWHRSQVKVAFVIFPLWAFFLFFASETIILLFGEAYAKSILIFQLFLFLVPARLTTFSRIVTPMNKNWIYTLGHLVQLVIGYIACFLLYFKFEIIGAAIGVIVSIYANIIFMGFLCSRLLGIKFLDIWPFKRLILYLIVSMLCGLFAYFVCQNFSSENNFMRIFNMMLGILICGGSYLFIMNKLNLFNFSEWKSLLLPPSRKSSSSA